MAWWFESVYNLWKSFRDEKQDKTHLPEFTTVEFYKAYVDYNYMIAFLQDMLTNIIYKTTWWYIIKFWEYKIDFSKFQIISMHNILNNKYWEDLYKLNKEKLINIAKREWIKYSKNISKWNIIIDIFEKLYTKDLINPTFVIDFPKDSSVFCYDITMAKEKRDNDNILERFELYIWWIELANCYSELNDPRKQEWYFSKFIDDSSKNLEIDKNFMHALRIWMPPSSWVGLWVDRLLQILLEEDNIERVIPFCIFNE